MTSQGRARSPRAPSPHPRISTPRLSARALAVTSLLVTLGVLAASRLREAPKPASAARPRAAALPREPPVELLAVKDSGFPCAVERVLEQKCRRCHAVPARHAAPLPLLTWEQTRGSRHGVPIHSLIGQAVQSGFMPMRILANPPVEPLTDVERSVLVDWSARGGPREICRVP